MADWSYMRRLPDSNFITRNWETIRQVRKPVIASVAGLRAGRRLRAGAGLRHHHRRPQREVRACRKSGSAMLPGAGGTQRLPRAIGKAKAMDMCLSARMLDAEEADRYGLVSRVVPTDALMSATLTLAQQMASYSLPALMAIKESVNRAWESSLSEGILFERRALHARFASADAHEGMHAFLEKRPPAVSHR
jgi:cyclohex-1-ene-1-carboxyl-CoA hydratase